MPLCSVNGAGHCPHWTDHGEGCHYCDAPGRAELVRIGDGMQSEASRLADWALAHYDDLPYEVQMAAAAIRSSVSHWTTARTTPQEQADDGCGELRGELRGAQALLWAICVSANPRKIDPDSHLADSIRDANTYLNRRGLTDPDQMELWHRIAVGAVE